MNRQEFKEQLASIVDLLAEKIEKNFIENRLDCEETKMSTDFDEQLATFPTAADVLISSFTWKESKEGQEAWSFIDDLLNEASSRQ